MELRRDRGAVPVDVRGQAGRAGARHVHEHLGEHGLGLGPDRGRPAGQAAAVSGQLSDHAGVGHSPRAVEAQELRCAHAPGRGRDRRRRGGPGCFLRRLVGDHHDQRSGRRPQVRDHRAGRQPRIAVADHRHPARRSVHGPADQDRAGRPPAGHVRPPRGGASTNRGALDARRLLLRRHRGGPHRHQVPHPGVPAVRRISGQRGGAVADSRRGGPARHQRPLCHRAQSHRRGRRAGVLALPSRPGHPGPPVGHSRHHRA